MQPHGLQQASLSFTLSRSLLRFLSIELVMPSNHLILCRPLFLLSSIFPSIRVFSSELTHCIRWPEYWSFSICPSNKYSGLISFRIDWFHLTTQGTLKESSLAPQFGSISSKLSFSVRPHLDFCSSILSINGGKLWILT